MSQEQKKSGFTRRDFIKMAAAAGAATLLPCGLSALLPGGEPGFTAQAKGHPTPTLSPEQQATWDKVIGKHETRYRARFLFDLPSHTLPTYLNADIQTTNLDGVANALLNDVNTIIDGVNNGAFVLEDFGNFGDMFLTGGDKLGIKPQEYQDSLKSATPLSGKIGPDGHLYWSLEGGDKVFAKAKLYDPARKGERQVLAGVTSAGRARQVFTAIATSIAAARGGDPLAYRNQIEAALGFTSLNGDSGSEFSISCFKTFPRKQDPKVNDIETQEAWYLENGSDLHKKSYPSLEVGLGKAIEVDLHDDGNGRIILSSEESVNIVVVVEPNGRIKALVTGTSDNLIDYDGQRDQTHAAGSEWRPCGPRTPAKKEEKPQAPSLPGPGEGPNIPSTPSQPLNPSPAPTNIVNPERATPGSRPPVEATATDIP